MTAFYWVQKLPRFAWIHLYIVTRRDSACLRWVASLGTELRPVLRTEGEKRYFILKREPYHSPEYRLLL